MGAKRKVGIIAALGAFFGLLVAVMRAAARRASKGA